MASSPRLHVEAWVDPVVDTLGFDARGPYLDFVALGRLGPTSSWCLRHLAYRLAAHPEGYDISLAELGNELGLGRYTGRSSHLGRALDRLEVFGMARGGGPDVLQVRRRIPPLTEAQLARLAPSARDVHRMMVAARDAERPRRDRGDTATDLERRRERSRAQVAERDAGVGL